jgi:hypothetical protein
MAKYLCIVVGTYVLDVYVCATGREPNMAVFVLQPGTFLSWNSFQFQLLFLFGGPRRIPAKNMDRRKKHLSPFFVTLISLLHFFPAAGVVTIEILLHYRETFFRDDLQPIL